MAMKSSVQASTPTEIEIFHDEIDGFLCLSSAESEEIDLSYWEFINQSDADSDDEIDIDNLSVDGFQNGLFVSRHSSRSSSTENPEENREILTARFDDLDNGEEKPDLDDLGTGGFAHGGVSFVGNQLNHDDYDDGWYGHDHNDQMDDADDDDNMDDGDHGYGLDDELVPWSVSGKLGRQRMRKLGKRVCAKMNYSKKSPFLYMKPGCVHGKHGLGLKHSF